MTRSGHVVVVGSANADLVVAVDQRPSAGQTVLGGDLRVSPGGKGANMAVAAALLGADVTFVGCVGDDGYGALLRRSIRDAGVRDDLLATRSGVSTGTALILITPDGDNSIVVSPGANGTITPDDVESAREALAAAAVIVLQREIDPQISCAAARIAHEGGARVLLVLAPSGPVPAELLHWADPLVVNEQEARDLLASGVLTTEPPGAGGRDAGGADLALLITRGGPASAVVTLGAAGAVAATAAGVVSVPAPVVDAVDTTGAGDALAGALAWRLAAGDDLGAALAVAVQVSALSVTRPGAQPSYPRAGELTL
jgi:ribokinase